MFEEEDELEDLKGISSREYIRGQFAEYGHFEGARRREEKYWNNVTRFENDFKPDMIDDYSLWEDNFGSSKVNVECNDYSVNYTNFEEDFWEARKKLHREEI